MGDYARLRGGDDQRPTQIRVEQRPGSGEVARAEHPALLPIPDDECVVALEVLRAPLAPRSIGGEDEMARCRAADPHVLLGQVVAQVLAVVEGRIGRDDQVALVDYQHVAAASVRALPLVPACRQRDTGRAPRRALIRTAGPHRVEQAAQEASVEGALIEGEHAEDSAHDGCFTSIGASGVNRCTCQSRSPST